MTERSYLIPVLASALLHVGAFLAIHAGDTPTNPPNRLTRAAPPLLIPFDAPPPDPVDVDPFDSGPSHASPPSPVELPDTPQTAEPSRFQVEAQPVNPNIDLHATIPTMVSSISPGIAEGPPRIGTPIDSRFLDHEPKSRYQRAPLYPSDARQQGITGRCIVEFVVDEMGRVSNARIVSSSDMRFEAPSLQAVMSWRFEPGRRSGQPVRFRMQVPVEYSLNQD